MKRPARRRSNAKKERKPKRKNCRICKHREREQGRTVCSTCRSRKDREKYPLRNYFENMKHHAKERGIPFKLTWEFFQFACGCVDFVNHMGCEADDLTVDRVDAERGYEDDNIDFITNSQNATKWNLIDKPRRYFQRGGKR